LRFALRMGEVIADRDIAILAVGTPSRADGGADLQYVHAATDEVAKLAPKGLVLATRSTVPPGTGDALQERLSKAGRSDVQVCSAPEFLAEGTAVKDFQQPDRLVFGGPAAAARKLGSLWDGIRPEAPRTYTDRPTAELAKYAANTFLAARVSLINEMANLCDAVGADVRTLSTVVGQDTRIGAKFLRPGVGYGGSCFPKDVRALADLAHRLGVKVPVTEAVEQTNEAQWTVLEQRALRILGESGEASGKVVAILGIAFKPGTDDTRYAPGLRIAASLRKTGATVRMHDPVAKLPAELSSAGVVQARDVADAVRGSHVVLHVTEWPEYAALDWSALRSLVVGAHLLDGRNALPWERLTAAGWKVTGMGARPRPALAEAAR
jgi:UDPglucose 6-dehydrogenase